MTLNIKPLNERAIEMEVKGTLEKDDYETFVPLAEAVIEKHDKISLLLQVKDFSGWKPSALWEDLKFDIKHYTDVEKLALVGKDESKSWMATVSKPFTAADVKFFTENQLEEARRWVC
ncbi:MAG: STAS/SEC14 domain-containing protein [Bdellovibrionales bacterium]|nr:STAS/SEC14 domain-containing protein [Bdellovibrionales bacterium]